MSIPQKIEKIGSSYYVSHPTIPGGWRKLDGEAAAVAERRTGTVDGEIGTNVKSSELAEWKAAAKRHYDDAQALAQLGGGTFELDHEKLGKAIAAAMPVYTPQAPK